MAEEVVRVDFSDDHGTTMTDLAILTAVPTFTRDEIDAIRG